MVWDARREQRLGLNTPTLTEHTFQQDDGPTCQSCLNVDFYLLGSPFINREVNEYIYAYIYIYTQRSKNPLGVPLRAPFTEFQREDCGVPKWQRESTGCVIK